MVQVTESKIEGHFCETQMGFSSGSGVFAPGSDKKCGQIEQNMKKSKKSGWQERTGQLAKQLCVLFISGVESCM